MGEPTEIRAKLVLDDAASKTVDLVKGGFDKLQGSVSMVQREVLGFVKTSASMALGFQFDHGIQSLKMWAGEAMDASKAAGEQTKAIAGMLAMGDQQGRSMDELKKDAKGYRDRLNELGIQAGVSGSAVVDAFTDIQERSSRSADENEKMTEQMIYAGKIVPGGLSAITEGYRAMELGMVKAKNPLVMLIAQSGLMHGNAKEIAKQLQKMAPEEAMRVADTAIGKMAEKGKAMPLKGGAMIQSIKDMANQAMEGAGDELMKALGKPHAVVRQLFMENRSALAGVYKDVGEGLGDGITWGVEQAKHGIDYIKDHSKEIKDGIKEAWDYAKRIFDFILAHKSEIMIGMGAMTASKVLPSAAGAVGSVAGGVGDAATGVFSIFKMLGSADFPSLAGSTSKLREGAKLTSEVFNGLLFPAITKMSPEASKLAENLTSGAKGMAAFALAAGAVYLAVDQASKLMAEEQIERDAKLSGAKALSDLAKQGWSEQLKNALASDTQITAAQKAAAAHLADIADMQAKGIREQAGAMVGMMGSTNNNVAGQAYEELAKQYNLAIDMGNDSTSRYVAALMLNSGNSAQGLINSGVMLHGGLKKFEELFSDASDDVLAKLKDFVGDAYKQKNLKAAAPQINFNNNKFDIHQDFRNEDPDRIALVFRRDLLKAAEHRRQARMGTSFGL